MHVSKTKAPTLYWSMGTDAIELFIELCQGQAGEDVDTRTAATAVISAVEEHGNFKSVASNNSESHGLL